MIISPKPDSIGWQLTDNGSSLGNMNVLAAVRRHRKAWGRNALAAFAVAWLSLVAQPCVMALEVDDHGDCPHCPPAMAHHEGHDMAAMAMPCADNGDCDTLDDFNYGGRSGDIKLKQFDGKVVALLPPALSLQQAQLPCRARSVPQTDHHSGAAPPLYVLNCVYLD
ncbi:MAG: hypothetical protein KJO54_01980 [Gammaproteobacteria bacterium]|nr:hypothetical protein [Gammaproteobacteria bacterium]NNF59965.1 hypothetical protein [Gammaproteobacteria bacterium]